MDDEELRRLERESESDPTARLRLARERDRKAPGIHHLTLARITQNHTDGTYSWERWKGSGGATCGTAVEMNGSKNVPVGVAVVIHDVEGELFFFFPIG